MRDQKLNVRLLFWMSTAFFGVGTLVHLVHGNQVQRQGEAFLSQADRAERAGRLDQAALLLGRYLALQPEDMNNRARYALLLDRKAISHASLGPVLSSFQDVLARDPGQAAIRRRLVDRALELGQFALAEKNLRILLAAQPRDGKLLELLGQCQEARGGFAEAAASYERALRNAPHQIVSYVRLAELLRHRLDHASRAQEVMDALVKANPESAEAFLLRAQSSLTYSSLEEAGKDLARARKLSPNRAEVLETSASLAQLQGDLRAARAYWERGLEQYPRNGRMYQGLAELELRAGRPRLALACLRRGLKELPDNRELLFSLADACIEQGELEQARLAMNRLQQANNSTTLAAYLQGRLLMRQGQWLSAARVLNEACRAGEVSAPVLSRVYRYLGECYQHLGYAEPQLAAFRDAVALDQTFLFAKLRLGASLLALGKSDEAVAVFEEVTRRPLAPEGSWTYLARARMQQALHLPPKQRRWEHITSALERASQSAGQAAPVAILRAEVCFVRGRPDQARAVLDQALQQHPGEATLWVFRVQLASRQGDWDKAEQVLQDALGRLGDRLDLRMARVDLLAQQGGPASVRGLLDLEKGLNTFTPDAQVNLLRTLAQGHARLGALAQATRLYHMLLERNPEDLESRILLLDLVLKKGPDNALRWSIQDFRRLEGDQGTWWRWGEAARLIVRARQGEKEGLRQTRALLKEVEARRSGWDRLPLLKAYLEEVEGNPGQALEHYLRAIALGSRDLPAVQRTVELLAKRGRFMEADQVIRIYQDSALLGPEFARVASAIALRAGDPGRAVELARQAVAGRSLDYRAYLWLGEMLAAAGGPGEAEQALRRAVAIAPAIADARVALIRFLARTDQKEKADAALEEIPLHLTPDQVPLALAQGYEAMGSASRAQEQYQVVVIQKPWDYVVLHRAAQFYARTNQPDRAEPLLRTLASAAVQAPAEIQAWARRQLALVLAFAPRGQGYTQALALLDRNRISAGLSPAEERAWAFVRAVQPGKRKDALKALEEMREKESFPPDEEFRMALLYEAENDWPHTQRLLVAAVTYDPKNPAYLEYYIQALLKRGLTEEARIWLARLANLEPESRRTMELKGKIQKNK